MILPQDNQPKSEHSTHSDHFLRADASTLTQWERWRWDWQSRNNALQWALRNFLHWTPGHYRETPAGPKALRNLSTETAKLAETLLKTYGLSLLPHRASEQRVLETLTYLHWLDQMRQSHPQYFQALGPNDETISKPFRWLDVGAKNWAYVEALDGFLQRFLPQPAVMPTHPVLGETPSYRLDGVELDPHRRYTNLQTRAQAAQAFIQVLPYAAYHAGPIQHWQESAQVISLFLPFVFEEPHLAWGLPLDYFAPQALLNHLLHLLEPGGLLIIVNQGDVEAEAQGALFDQAQADCPNFQLQIKNLGQLDTPFIEYRYPRIGWLCRKQFLE